MTRNFNNIVSCQMLSSIQNSSGVAPCRRKMAATPCFFLSELTVVSLVFSLSQLNFEQSLYRDVPNRSHPTDSFYPVNPWILSFQTEKWFLWGKNLQKSLRPLPHVKSQLPKCKKKTRGDRWSPKTNSVLQLIFFTIILKRVRSFLGPWRKVFERKILLKK